MKVFFVASGNKGELSPITDNQAKSIAGLPDDAYHLGFYLIKGKGLFGYLKNVPLLRTHVKTNDFDIIHAHYSLSGMVAAIARLKKPLVVSLMGSDTKTGSIQKCITRLFARFFWDRLIIKSGSMKDDLKIGSALVIPNGVNLEKFKPIRNESLKDKFLFSNRKITILFLADPKRKVKNYDLARSAIEMLDSSGVDFQVRFNISQDLVNEVLNAADIILLTSHWEGSPNVIKEAMACNRPIVSTDVGDVRWLFGETQGCFIASNNPEDVAEKLRKAIVFSQMHGQTEGRKRLIDLGLDSVTIAKRIVEVYESLLQRRDPVNTLIT